MPLRPLLVYKNADSTQDLNDSKKGFLGKGIYSGGAVDLVPGQLQVTISPFIASGFDGMMVREDVDTHTFTVTANQTQRIVLRAVYVSGGPPTLDMEVISEANFATDPQQQYLITFCQLVIPLGASQVLSSYINLNVRDDIDPTQRLTWRSPVATSASLPLPPTVDTRVGDVRVTVDTFRTWIYTGANGWQIVPNPDGILNLLDYRLKFASGTNTNPWFQIGRQGIYLPSDGDTAFLSHTVPTYPPLSKIAKYDVDIGAVIAQRAVRQATGAVYVKGRSNIAATVQAGDLRIGFETGISGLVNTVQGGDPDIGNALSNCSVAVGSVDDNPTYVYLKVGLNPLVVEVGDIRLFEFSKNGRRIGLTAGYTATLMGDLDIGDSLATGMFFYSTTAGTENFYATNTAALTAVAQGDGFFRLSPVTNSSYDTAGNTIKLRTDRGYLELSKPTATAAPVSKIIFDSDDAGNTASMRMFQANDDSGPFTEPKLRDLIGGPTSTPVYADYLHIHADMNRGDGIVSGLAPTSGGGTNVTIAAGTAYVNGKNQTNAGGLIPLNNTA